MKQLILGFCVVLCIASTSLAKEIKVGIKDTPPKEVAVGDVIVIERPHAGGLNDVTVTVDGVAVKGESVPDKVDGKVVIGGGRIVSEVKAEKAGKIVIEITVTPKGGEAKKEKHEVIVK